MKEVIIGSMIFNITSEYKVEFEAVSLEDNYCKIQITVRLPQKEVPEPVKIEWKHKCVDIFSQWNPTIDINPCLMPDWWNVQCPSRLAFCAPLQVHLGLSGNNRSTVALKDTKTPCKISSGVYEEDACIRYKVLLFSEKVAAMDEYRTELLIDMRDIPFYESIQDVQKWWDSTDGNTVSVPESACMPMYSTWYAMHQNLESEDLLNELRIAKEYGLDSVIIDDGWQTENSQRGYAFCGDWEVANSKIPDMSRLVNEIHNIDMKCILWFSIPFVGKNSTAYDKFKDKLLKDLEKGWGILDPRYPDVRRYLCSVYEKAVSEWKVDGLKLDFIDSFELSEESHYSEQMDYESLEDAICCLMEEIYYRLIKLNPEVMIEFRQNYIGPVMRKYGNMLRVADCPNDALRNRILGANLRLTSGGSAVHSDMIMWNYDDSVESAARQILNVLFLVPQISVRIEKLPENHRKMLKFYMDFWIKNRDCLLKGKLKVYNPESNYSLITSENESEMVAICYTRNVVRVGETDHLVIINATGDGDVILDFDKDCRVRATTVDCTGEILEQRYIKIEKGVTKFNVPCSGMVKIEGEYNV